MTRDLVRKVILITGATDGIGKAAATEFAGRGATLTILGRNREKTEKVLVELKAASGNTNLTPQKQALDPKLAADLWELSERLCAQAASRAA